jgi:hypothetical protein
MKNGLMGTIDAARDDEPSHPLRQALSEELEEVLLKAAPPYDQNAVH